MKKIILIAFSASLLACAKNPIYEGSPDKFVAGNLIYRDGGLVFYAGGFVSGSNGGTKFYYIGCGDADKYNGLIWEVYSIGGKTYEHQYLKKFELSSFLFASNSKALPRVTDENALEAARKECRLGSLFIDPVAFNYHINEHIKMARSAYGLDPDAYIITCDLKDALLKPVTSIKLKISPNKKTVNGIPANFSGYGQIKYETNNKFKVEISDGNIMMHSDGDFYQGECAKGSSK